MADECCLPDIRISELPSHYNINFNDYLVLDVYRPNGVYETHKITWGHLLGVFPPGDIDPDGPQPPEQNLDNEIILNGIVKFIDGTELRPSITFIRDDNTGFYRPGDNTIGVTTGGTRTVVFKDDYVGIGTDYPQQKLHIEQGNIFLRHGMDESSNNNTLWLGSSNRSMGGDPSVQSLSDQPLTFHVNEKEFYRFNEFGALGIREFYGADDSVAPNYGPEPKGVYGDPDYVPAHILVSRGEGETPTWNHPDTVFDLAEIIKDIDDNYIGKGPLVVYPQLIKDDDTVEFPTSGLDYAPIGDPNANSFDEAGWNLNVDSTVLRTVGVQTVGGTMVTRKHFQNDARLEMDGTSVFAINNNANGYINNGGKLTTNTDGEQVLANKSDFLFDSLDHFGVIRP